MTFCSSFCAPPTCTLYLPPPFFSPCLSLLSIAPWLESSHMGSIQSPFEQNYSKSSCTFSSFFKCSFFFFHVFGTLSCHLLHSVMHWLLFPDNIPRRNQLEHVVLESSYTVFPSAGISPVSYVCQWKMMGFFHWVIQLISLEHFIKRCWSYISVKVCGAANTTVLSTD